MAIEILFGASDTRLDRVSEMRLVEIPAMPSDPIVGFENLVGTWIEVRDSTGRVVYRRVLHDFDNQIEGPGEGSGQFVHVPSPDPPTLRVVVPEISGGRAVLLASASPGSRVMDVIAVDLPDAR